jgi:uncharacterized LabA/DUF88 family protein
MSTPEPEFISALRPHPANRLAVFIDIENLAGYCADMGVPVDIAPVLEHLSQCYGRVQIKRSFGDVSSLPTPVFSPYRIRRMLQAHQIDHLDIPHRPTSYSKNSADIRLVVEAVALIHQRPDITHIVVVSNDRDFIPLFNHAREHGKVVIGCGPRRTHVNDDYRNACDVFLYHEDWVSPKPADTPPPPVAAPVHAPAPLAAPTPLAVTVAAATPDASSTEASEASPAPEQSTPTSTATAAARVEAAPSAAAPNEPIDYLLAALRSLQAEGSALVASRVAARMKLLFPAFDVKLAFGSFKLFCIEQEKTGRIGLQTLTQPNFTLTLPDLQTAPPPPEEPEANLLAKYRDWSYQKLKIPFPSPTVRARFYDILAQVLGDCLGQSDFVPLQELSRLCSIELGAVTSQADDVAFRLSYGLFRGKAFRYYKTENAFNPDITGWAVEPSQWDDCFIHNTRTSFIHDSRYHGLPLHEETLARLVQGDEDTAPLPTEAEVGAEAEVVLEVAVEADTEPLQSPLPLPLPLQADETPDAEAETEVVAEVVAETETEKTVEAEPVPMLADQTGTPDNTPTETPDPPVSLVADLFTTTEDATTTEPPTEAAAEPVSESTATKPKSKSKPKPVRITATARKKTTPAAVQDTDAQD